MDDNKPPHKRWELHVDFVVDPHNVISETNEGNNVIFIIWAIFQSLTSL